MSWFARKPTEQQKAVQTATDRLDEARENRKSAFDRLKRKIEEIPIDDALAYLGRDIGGNRD